MEEARKARETPFDPKTIPGLLEPKAPEKKARKRDQSRIDVSEGGSFTLRRLHEKKVERQMEEARLEAIAQDKRDTAARKKREREEDEASLQAAWACCGGGCSCGLGDGCRVKGLQRCEHCGDVKKMACRKKPCMEKAAPRLLTYKEAPLQLSYNGA